ncbi:MAG: ATP phosphoribosyltransferase regulatory subunit [Kordiimonas sp.]|nr:ATP phosphoribosyltransferase regulatory subunit [Kordiimonas sp.]
MADEINTALLPEGLHDRLAPKAAFEAHLMAQLQASFASYGYDRVEPPLVEFEEGLLTGPGTRLSRHMFRVMDPASQRMMAVRADMTGQVARIGRTRLAAAARPLRLCYGGDVLRVKGSQLRPERQFKQAGVELIGADNVEAYVDVLLLAADALQNLGVEGLSIDLTMPRLVPTICEGLGLEPEVAAEYRNALNAKDSAALQQFENGLNALGQALVDIGGPASAALEQLMAISLPMAARDMVEEISRLVTRLADVMPHLTLTLDPVEYQGFEFQTGIGFTLFARGVRGELGRGGRYVVSASDDEEDKGEVATGFSVYLDSVSRAVKKMPMARKVFVPYGTDKVLAEELRAQNWRTVQGLEAGVNVREEAQRLGCSHVLCGDEVEEV